MKTPAGMVLPIAHDCFTAWDMICPDIVQRVLLEVIAVDSPMDDRGLRPDWGPGAAKDGPCLDC